MQKVLIIYIIGLLSMLLPFIANAGEKLAAGGPYTEEVNGIEWTFLISESSEAILGVGDSTAAISNKTEGAIVVPETLGSCQVTVINDAAFIGCRSVTSIIFPSTIVSINDGAFCYCDNLESFNIPESVKKLGGGLIHGNRKLEKIFIPASVESIDGYAFWEGFALKEIEVDKGNPNYTSVGGVLYNKNVTLLIYCPGALTEMTLPASVTTVSEDSCLSGCCQIANFYVEEGNACFKSVDGILYTKDGTALVRCPIQKTSAIVEKGVTTIGDFAFCYCMYMATLTLPSGIVKAGHFSFEYASELKTVYLYGEDLEWIKEYINDSFLHIYPTYIFIGDVPDNLVVADEWFGRFTDFDIKFSSDHQKALSFATGKRGADGSMRYVWQDYVAGTDPTNPDDKFTASITFDENNKPIIGWSPELKDESGNYLRKYTVYGKAKLNGVDDWVKVKDDAENYNFFKVTVEMP